MKKRQANINIDIVLNENNIPEEIFWQASDSKIDRASAQAFFLSFWDTDSKKSFNIDLWNKEMTMEEMKFFIFQSLLKMSSVLERSTGDENLVKKMKEFSKQFGKMANVLK
tara:strand:- start:86 stop:418 length:333 start_codon:yes stop_codon:yes gene_type:complete